MLEFRLTRSKLESLIPGHPIDKRVVDMVAMRNACSIQHLKHPTFLCLPPRFAHDVERGLSAQELAEAYIPFWIKPSRFISHIFMPMEDSFHHSFCMVVDYDLKMAFRLDSWPEPLMVPEQEGLMRKVLRMLQDIMTSSTYGPLRLHTPPNLGGWPIRAAEGIPNCDTRLFSTAWVISWLNPEGRFNLFRLNGVLDDSTLRGRIAVELVSSPFNAHAGLARYWAEQWQRKRTSGRVGDILVSSAMIVTGQMDGGHHVKAAAEYSCAVADDLTYP
ncbi:hypothetical protein PIB30_054876 [Stylosanthes scabra]|uniref:Uncharacterized protein n=1 Tax=Stylosanthes scabra TaxID=79078 RepID=A0ABU6XHG2_9FABA|nr:hypothetical protein [Stylosanthes scabra]